MGVFELSILLVFVISFLLGSIPWGLIISKLFYKKDLRKHGSGNIGTTNALRTLGKVGGGIVFLLDFGKGVLAGAIALFIYSKLIAVVPLNLGIFDFKGLQYEWMDYSKVTNITKYTQILLATAACGCIVGHVFSPWLKFKGGKGVAVAVGCLFVSLGWYPAVAELALFAWLVYVSRYVSVGSITAATVLPFVALWVYGDNGYAVLMLTIAAVVVIWAHRGNIKRLRQGTELRIGAKKGDDT